MIGVQSLAVQGMPVNNDSIVAIHKEQFKKDYNIKGLFSENQEMFYVDQWKAEDCWITIDYSVTQLVDEYLSDMTLSVNGTSFYTQRLRYNNTSRQQLKVRVPKEYLQEGLNTVTLETYIRTEEGLPCVDDVSTANWMNIYKESNIKVKYKPIIEIKSIADLYKQMTSIYSLDYKKSLVATPPSASDEVLSGAVNVLAALAPRALMNYENIAFDTVSTLSEIKDKQFIMYVSTPKELPPQFKSLLTAKELEEAQQLGLMKLVELPEGKHMLLVLGSDLQMLMKVGQLIQNPELMQQLQGKEKWINPSEDVATRINQDLQYYQLTSQGSYLKGPFRRAEEFYIDFPKNRLLADSSQMYLKMRYSENLDFDRSLVSVYINEIPVGSKKLSLAKANGDELLLDIPMDIQLAGPFSVKVAFDLEIKDLWCTLRQGETPWAFISNESMLKLNTLQNPFLLLEHYPAPFVKDHHFNEVNIVVPNEVGNVEYDLLGPLALTMGRFVKNNEGSFKVTRESNAVDISEDNVIIVGTYRENQLIKDLNDKLFFKFSEDGQSLLSNEKKVLDAEYSKTLGTIQLIESPYNNQNQKAAMVISGVDEKGMLDAASYLGTLEGLWHLEGDACITNEQEIDAYRFKEENATQLKFTDKMMKRKDLLPLGIAIIAVGMLLILIIVMLIKKYVKRGRL